MIGGIVIGFVIANLLLNAVTVLALWWGFAEYRSESQLDRRLRAIEERIKAQGGERS